MAEIISPNSTAVNTVAATSRTDRFPIAFSEPEKWQIEWWRSHMPTALRERARWLLSKTAFNGEWFQMPLDPETGRSASILHQSAGLTYDNLMEELKEDWFGASGIGIILRRDYGLFVIELEGCRDAKSGAIESWAQKIISRFRSYSEATPCGTGIRIFVQGHLPVAGYRRGNIGVYGSRRFVPFTGYCVSAYLQVEDRGEEAQRWCTEVFSPDPDEWEWTPVSYEERLSNGLVPMRETDQTYEFDPDDEETVEQFIEDRCEVDPDSKVAFKDLLAAFSEWCETNDEFQMPDRLLGFLLCSLDFFPATGADGTRFYHGLSLRSPVAAPAPKKPGLRAPQSLD